MTSRIAASCILVTLVGTVHGFSHQQSFEDGDADVDAEDAGVFLRWMSGANTRADPHCTD